MRVVTVPCVYPSVTMRVVTVYPVYPAVTMRVVTGVDHRYTTMRVVTGVDHGRVHNDARRYLPV